MMWESASDFFHMGGYGLYVWGSYAMCAAFMLAEPLLARHRHRQALRDAAVQTRDQEDPS
jgi:heme exporter protein D